MMAQKLAKTVIQVSPNVFHVYTNPWRSSRRTFVVERLPNGKLICECKYFQHARKCKHIHLVKIFLKAGMGNEASSTPLAISPKSVKSDGKSAVSTASRRHASPIIPRSER